MLKLTASRLVGFVLFVAFGALLFTASGFYDVAATAGHWPAVGWLLRYTMKNSVETHALLTRAPDLDDPALIERGAGHYETGCASCHGAPGRLRDRIPLNMLPAPPYLPPTVSEWSNEELFRLVKHGLKYTGMPAWPAEGRDDEVWAVVAFLHRLPELDAAGYAQAAMGAVESSDPPEPATEAVPETPNALFGITEASLIGGCARCHGLDGMGRASGAFPRLDIQTSDYLYRALRDYAEGRRHSGIMEPVAVPLNEEQIRRLADHFSGGATASVSARHVEKVPQSVLDRGLEIAAIGAPEREVPPCASCHGLEEGPANPLFPALGGQYAGHIMLQLELWKAGERGRGAYSEVMETIAGRLTPAEVEAVAHYYESLATTAEQAGAESADLPRFPL